MRRRHEDQGRGRQATNPLHALLVQTHPDHARTGCAEGGRGAGIAGILDPDIVAGGDDGGRDQGQRSLRARQNQDLIRRRAHAPAGRKIMRQCLAQARPIDRSELAPRRAHSAAAQAARPDLVGKLPEIAMSGTQGSQSRLIRHRPVGLREARRPGRKPRLARAYARCDGASLCDALAAVDRNHRTAAVRGFEISLGGELLERIADGVARDAEIARKPTARRQRAAFDETPGRDQASELARQLSHQPLVVGPVQVDQGGDHAVRNWHPIPFRSGTVSGARRDAIRWTGLLQGPPK